VPSRHAELVIVRNLAIDAERLWGELMESAAIGGVRYFFLPSPPLRGGRGVAAAVPAAKAD
jgi:hypothetical protein